MLENCKMANARKIFEGERRMSAMDVVSRTRPARVFGGEEECAQVAKLTRPASVRARASWRGAERMSWFLLAPRAANSTASITVLWLVSG